MNVALLGDSILDNGAYVGGGRDVATHLHELLPADTRIDLLARDGSRIEQIESRISRVREDTTHIIVSAGGNDAIDVLGLLDQPVTTVGEALRIATELYNTFRYRYRGLLTRLQFTGCSVSVCTIYEPRFTEGDVLNAALGALALLNDAIIREAGAALIPVLELRCVCDGAEDFANPIEPSDTGGRKIAQAIAGHLIDSGSPARAIKVYW